MEVIRQFVISTPIDILSLDIIEFNKLNGCWRNSGEAMTTILSWFKGHAIATEITIPNYFDAPIRQDFPGWKHVGDHEEVGRQYWNWFWWNHPDGHLTFSDSPDFYGDFGSSCDARFWGDVGKVSASAFAHTQKQMRDHDLWISLLGDGSHQVLIEPHLNILHRSQKQFMDFLLGGSRG